MRRVVGNRLAQQGLECGLVDRVAFAEIDRPPFAAGWQDLDPDTALDMIAERVWTTRERGFVAERDGLPLMQCTNIAHLGGATLDNEENYLIKKLFAGGLGMVAISNQARI